MNQFSLGGMLIDVEEGEFCQFTVMIVGEKLPMTFYVKPEVIALLPAPGQEVRVEGRIRTTNRGAFDKNGKAQGKLGFSLSPSKINGVAIPTKQGKQSDEQSESSGTVKRRPVSNAA